MSVNFDSKADMILYGHNYCPQVSWLVRELKKHEIDYEWRDVRVGEERWQEDLRQLANGYLSVPTVVFPDGVVMVEPRPKEVLTKLGIEQTGWLQRLTGQE